MTSTAHHDPVPNRRVVIPDPANTECVWHITTSDIEIDDTYRASTRDLSIDTVGFVHLARGDQLTHVVSTFYADCDEVRLWAVDAAVDGIVHDTVVLDPETGHSDTFPHLYRPLTPDMVRGVCSWHRGGPRWHWPGQGPEKMPSSFFDSFS